MICANALKIRPVVREDHEGLLDLVSRIYPIGPAQRGADTDIAVGILWKSAVVATFGSGIVGVAVAASRAQDASWKVARVLVVPERRRRGVGRALLEGLVGAAPIWCETVTAELPALEPEGARELLYAARFQPVGADPRQLRFYRVVERERGAREAQEGAAS
jgi:GNAT superfamily N-acetyltransferase